MRTEPRFVARGLTMTKPRWLVGLTEYAGITRYTGGIGRHYASLLPALVRAGIDVDLVLFDPETLLTRVAPGGVRLIAHRRFSCVPAALSPLVRALSFRAIAASGDYDRILVPEWAGVAALLPRTAPLVTNLATSMRVSNHISGIDIPQLPPGRRRVVAVQNWCEDRQIRRSRGVVPISRTMEGLNRKLLGTLPPTAIVRNCTDVETVQELAESPGALPTGWPEDGKPIVLFLGRLERRKGVLDAAEAFGRLKNLHSAARFVFAGAPGDRRFEPTYDDIRSRIGADERTILLGHVPGAELYRAIARADVVVCPSRWEGFGQVALEAKAIGRPLVVTGGSGYDDFCVDGVDSLVTPPGDPEALAHAVSRLLTDHVLAHRLGASARAHINRFTADAVAPDFIAAVDKLAMIRARQDAAPSRARFSPKRALEETRLTPRR